MEIPFAVIWILIGIGFFFLILTFIDLIRHGGH